MNMDQVNSMVDHGFLPLNLGNLSCVGCYATMATTGVAIHSLRHLQNHAGVLVSKMLPQLPSWFRSRFTMFIYGSWMFIVDIS